MYIPSRAPPVAAYYKYFWSMFLYLAISTLYYILSNSSRHPVCVFFCDIAVTFFSLSVAKTAVCLHKEFTHQWPWQISFLLNLSSYMRRRLSPQPRRL